VYAASKSVATQQMCNVPSGAGPGAVGHRHRVCRPVGARGAVGAHPGTSQAVLASRASCGGAVG
jgi:hypothetical protein